MLSEIKLKGKNWSPLSVGRFWNTNQPDLEFCHRGNLENMQKWPYGCPAEIWKGTNQEVDKRNKHASDQMKPDTAWGLSRKTIFKKM